MAAGYPGHFGKTMAEYGLTLRQWLELSFQSFLAVFGMMDILVSGHIYASYFVLFLLGFLPGMLYSLRRKESRQMAVFLLLLMILPPVFSFYRSCTYDYQPQGRYLFSALPAVMFFIITGYRSLGQFLCRIFKTSSPVLENSVLLAAGCCYILLFYFSVSGALFPLCTGIDTPRW